MKNNLPRDFKNLPIELVKYILQFKSLKKCIICKQNFEYNFYVKYLNRNLCCYRCYLFYFYGYTLYNSILFIHIIFSPILCTDIVFFKYYYLFVIVLCIYLCVEQFFFRCR
jgi:hypothetical protein